MSSAVEHQIRSMTYPMDTPPPKNFSHVRGFFLLRLTRGRSQCPTTRKQQIWQFKICDFQISKKRIERKSVLNIVLCQYENDLFVFSLSSPFLFLGAAD